MKQMYSMETRIPGILLTALLTTSAAHAGSGKDCLLDDRFYVQMQSTVGNRPFVATVEPDDPDSDVSRGEMCACAKAITWTLLEEYNEKFPAAHLRGVSKGGCQNYGDGGQKYELYWRQ